jgi:hypothetical protein
VKITKIAELNRQIKRLIVEDKVKDYPVEYEFNQGMEFPNYRIIVEKVDSDFYIDSKGTKWIREQNE